MTEAARVGLAVLAAALVTALGAVTLLGLRSRVTAQVAVAALTGVVAVAVASVAAPGPVALLAGAAGAVTVAVVLALQIRGDAAAVLLAARRLDEGAMDGPSTHRTLSWIAHDLDAVAHRLGASRAREREIDIRRRELVAWLSHDLRAPLSGVRVIAEALRDGVAADPDTLMAYVDALQLEVDRLDRLVSDLFELSSVQSGRRLGFALASLSDTVSDTLAGVAPVAAAKGVRLNGQLRTEVPPVALATREFERALQNLLDNAVRETPPGRTVTVEVGVEERSAVIDVNDECGGIPAEHLPHVFEPGVRSRGGTSSPGHGLGLAIAAAFVEAHGGTISVHNAGPGCRFRVRLPLAADVASGPSQP